MSNSMGDDYFSFMSNKWEDRQAGARRRLVAHASTSLLPSDTVEFAVESSPFAAESPIEGVESFVSDTIIQRLFAGFGAG